MGIKEYGVRPRVLQSKSQQYELLALFFCPLVKKIMPIFVN